MPEKKWLSPVIIFIFVIFSFFYYSLFLDRLSNIAYDILLRIRADKPERNIPVSLVTATENFSRQIGHEPNRKNYANLVKLLSESRIIVSDIFFSSTQSEEADRILRNSFNERSEKIILPVFTPYKLKNKINETGYRVDSLIENHPYFQSAVKHLGHINVFPDSDTIVRKCPAFIAFGQTYFPHIALKALSIYRNHQPVVVKKFTGFKKVDGIIPVDDDGCFLVGYLKPQALAEMIYTMEDVLSGKVRPDVFRGKIVIIGHTIMGTKNADLIPTPFGMQYGAIVQMQSLYTIISGTYIWKMGRKSMLVIMAFAMFLLLFVFSSSFWRGTRLFIVVLIALFYTSFFLFKYHNFFFDPVPVFFASSFSYIAFLTMNFIEARKEISKGEELLSVLESTQREIAAVIKPHEMPGMNKRVYLPAIHDTFFFKTPQITLQTINSLLGISDGVIFSLDKSSGKINILVSKENSSIKTELISIALKTIDSNRVKIYNRRLPDDFKEFSVSNFLILRILEEPFMNIYGLFVNKRAGPVSSIRYFTKNDYQWIASFCLQTVVALFNTQLNDALKKSQLETIMRLAAAIEYRDRETGMHITRVSEYCALIADKISLPRVEVELIKAAVPLHDLGKIAIPDNVLLKPSALTEKEKEIIRTHTIVGAKMLEGSDSFILQAAYLIALYHHEKYDGTGYPYGLKGNAIPLYGRIASLADVFDALSSSRVYKQAETFDQSIKRIEELAGKDFDPQIAEAFIKNKQLVYEIYSKYSETIS